MTVKTSDKEFVKKTVRPCYTIKSRLHTAGKEFGGGN